MQTDTGRGYRSVAFRQRPVESGKDRSRPSKIQVNVMYETPAKEFRAKTINTKEETV